MYLYMYHKDFGHFTYMYMYMNNQVHVHVQVVLQMDARLRSSWLHLPSRNAPHTAVRLSWTLPQADRLSWEVLSIKMHRAQYSRPQLPNAPRQRRAQLRKFKQTASDRASQCTDLATCTHATGTFVQGRGGERRKTDEQSRTFCSLA